LTGSGVINRADFRNTTGTYLAEYGVSGAKTLISRLSSSGVLFVDDTHLILEDGYSRSRVLDYLLAKTEDKRGKIMFILAGEKKGMQKLLGYGSKNISGLFPQVLSFPDFTDDQLLKTLGACITKKFDGKMQVEGGLEGVYMRISVKRIGRSRGSPQFGNARAAENAFAQMWERQSARLSKSREDRPEMEGSGATSSCSRKCKC
jgi:hypothetical protein